MKQFIIILVLLVFLLLIVSNIKFTPIVEDFSNSSCEAVSTSNLPKNHPFNLKCKSGPYVTNLLETKEDGTKIHRCKSKCAVKSAIGHMCCEPSCCSDSDGDSGDTKDKATSDILDKATSDILDKAASDILGKSVKNLDKVSDIGNDLTENSDDKLAVTTAERDAKLIEANDGRKILDPTSFSYKPEIKFDHKQPSIKVASSYGWSFMPPQFWSVPQKRPPACIPTEKTAATVMPIYDKGTPVDSLEWTKVGSILPKHEYTEVHNPNYYYPGWIAQDNANDPLDSGKKISKTGKYYNMNRAISTKEDQFEEIQKQPEETKKQPDETKKHLKKTRKQLEETKKQLEEIKKQPVENTLYRLNIPIDLRDYIRNEKYLNANVKSLEDYSGTKIDINNTYNEIIIEGSEKNINKVLNLLDKNGSGSVDAPSWKV